MKNFNIIKDLLRRHLRSIITYIVLINILGLLTFGIVFNNNIKYLNLQINNNISEYNEIDKEQLCNIVQCREVIDTKGGKIFKVDNKRHLRPFKNYKNNFKQIYGDLYLDNFHNLCLYNNKTNLYFILNNKEIFDDYILLLSYFIPLSLIIFTLSLFGSIKKEREEAILLTAGNEALLANKSMINITENIHHELNTPLEVIDNKVEKIYRTINNLPSDRTELKKILKKLNEDFDFIKTGSEQIFTVLEKMKGFKHLRYSNGNKSLKDIINGGFKIINISNTNFKYKIDDILNNYIIGNSNIKNADFLSIILNHIKNSLEANSSKIYILFSGEKDGYIFIRIIDNGNGIPKEACKKIFQANFSTKKSDSGVRGNGMYLNKQIMLNGKGDIKLIETSNRGTTFELKIPVKYRS